MIEKHVKLSGELVSPIVDGYRRIVAYTIYEADYYGQGGKLYLDLIQITQDALTGGRVRHGFSSDGCPKRIREFCLRHQLILSQDGNQ